MKFHQYSLNHVEVMAKKPLGGLIHPPPRLDRVKPFDNTVHKPTSPWLVVHNYVQCKSQIVDILPIYTRTIVHSTLCYYTILAIYMYILIFLVSKVSVFITFFGFLSCRI